MIYAMADCLFERKEIGRKRKRFAWVCSRCGRREPYDVVLVRAGCSFSYVAPLGNEVALDRRRSRLVELQRDGAEGRLRIVYRR